MRGILLILFVFCAVSYTAPAQALIKLGVGQSSTTGGRVIPAAYFGLDIQSFGLSVTTVGVKQTLSYMSSYQINAFLTARNAKFFWGTLESGLGWGTYIYEIGFKEDRQHGGLTKTGFATGPSFRVFWHFINHAFIGIEAMFGIRGYQALFLSAQDSSALVIGVDL